MNGQQIADLSSKKMWEGDKAAQSLGMKLVSSSPGQAVMTMEITENMSNGHDIAHGGFIFALADTAFAYASNSYGDAHVGQICDIVYIRPSHKGDILTAQAKEVSKTGRTGIYDVNVSTQGKTIAEFRGVSREVSKNFIGITVDNQS
ncbi:MULTISPECIES: hydroxyphenylacetyl-CoA thioesterase PaaI [Bartonella]|uniref:Acyl-CoA thioesterase n=1 Tax=Bartonella choladocola TaxID=2750995 RepID=A0A1U9MIQ5_9HYPH|nr:MULTISPECIES: hydroxyphenylacetyl-CoA thioesterase PaaI [Bartonella]AQT47589.1 acyl-CoA thioesterase [Bartonella choladocola]MBH9975759.1 hydroxyphenylacetyl-CoA thioesterase PaaI [Bartonella choladocola]MBI0015366.1 hydroxyphenylacetyl-CoA thioesterase PaaI [Bartonella sp. B10834G3]